jgi:gliding motility-associated-like protein
MVVQGEPVQLQGYGGQYYQWKPASWLSNSSVSNPVARPLDDILYTMIISNDDNCTDSATVKIRAFKDPDIYVPTAFTPNSDGLNDLFRVVPVGFILTELKIFDRWGNIVFVTRDETKGWDGTFRGQPLATGTFIWVATGKNKKTASIVNKKGQITLIR